MATGIIQAYKATKLNECKNIEIIQVLMYICETLLGKDITKLNKDNIVTYLKTNCMEFSLQDLKIAFELFIKSKLDYIPEEIYTFNGLLIQRVLQSFSRYRFNQIKDITMIEEQTSLTDAEKDESIRKGIIEYFEALKSGKKPYAVKWLWYDYLDRHEVLNLTKEHKFEFRKQAFEQIRDMNSKKLLTSNIYEVKRIKDYIEKLTESNCDVIMRAKELAFDDFIESLIEFDENLEI